MWNPNKQPPNQQDEEDDSWEVRAFAEDTADAMGTTWPPRSYTCTFCRREFRSAQALGGHMNVHRRDRARLHQSLPSTSSVVTSFPATSVAIPHPLLLQSRDFMAPEGLWFQLYQQLPNPIHDSNSALLSVWPYNMTSTGITAMNNYPQSPSSVDLSAQPPRNLPIQGHEELFHRVDQREASSSSETSQETRKNSITKNKYCSNEADKEEEEIDLELRLGQSRPPL